MRAARLFWGAALVLLLLSVLNHASAQGGDDPPAATVAVFGPADVSQLRLLTTPRNTRQGYSAASGTVRFYFKGRYIGTRIAQNDLIAVSIPTTLASPTCIFTFDGAVVPVTAASPVTVGAPGQYNLQYAVTTATAFSEDEFDVDTDARVFGIECSFTYPRVQTPSAMAHFAIATPGATPVIRAQSQNNFPTPEIQGRLAAGPTLTLGTSATSVKQLALYQVQFTPVTSVTYSPKVVFEVPVGFVFATMVTTGVSSSGSTTSLVNNTFTVLFSAAVTMSANVQVTIALFGAFGPNPQPANPTGLFILSNNESCRQGEDTGPGTCNLPDPITARDTNLVYSRTLSIPAITADVDGVGLDSSTFGITYPEPTGTFFAAAQVAIVPFRLPASGIASFLSQLSLRFNVVNATMLFQSEPITCTVDGTSVNSGVGVGAVRTQFTISGFNEAMYNRDDLTILCQAQNTAVSLISADPIGLRLEVMYGTDTVLITHYGSTALRTASSATDIPPYDASTPYLHSIAYTGTSVFAGAASVSQVLANVYFPPSHTLPQNLQFRLDVPSAGRLAGASCSMAVDVVIYSNQVVTFQDNPFPGGGYVTVIITADRSSSELPGGVTTEHRITCTGLRAPSRPYTTDSGLMPARFTEMELAGSTANSLANARVRLNLQTPITVWDGPNALFDVTFGSPLTAYASTTGDLVFTLDNTAIPSLMSPGAALEVLMPLDWLSPGAVNPGRDAVGNSCFITITNDDSTKTVRDYRLKPNDMYFQPLSTVNTGATTYSVRLRFPERFLTSYVHDDIPRISFRCAFHFPETPTVVTISARLLGRFNPGFGPAALAVFDASGGMLATSTTFAANAALSLAQYPSSDLLGAVATAGSLQGYYRNIVRSTPYVGAFATVDLLLRRVDATIGIRPYATAQESFELFLPDSFVYLPYTHCGLAWDTGSNANLNPALSNHVRFGVPSPDSTGAARLAVAVPQGGALAILPAGFFRVRCVTQNPLTVQPAYRGITATFNFASEPRVTTNAVRIEATQIAEFGVNNTLHFVDFTEFGSSGGFLRWDIMPNAFASENYRLRLSLPSGAVRIVRPTAGGANPITFLSCAINGGAAANVVGVTFADDGATPTDPPATPAVDVTMLTVQMPSGALYWPEDVVSVLCGTTPVAPTDYGIITLPSPLTSMPVLPSVSAELRAPTPGDERVSSLIIAQPTDRGVQVSPVTLKYDPNMVRTITAADYNSTNEVVFQLSALGFSLPSRTQFEFHLPVGDASFNNSTFQVPRNLIVVPCTMTLSGVTVPTDAAVTLTHAADAAYSSLVITVTDSVPARATATDLYEFKCLMLHPAAIIERTPVQAYARASVAPLHVFLDVPDVDFKGVFYMPDPVPEVVTSTVVTAGFVSQFSVTTFTVVVTVKDVDFKVYDELEIELPTTHLYEFRPSRRGTVAAGLEADEPAVATTAGEAATTPVAAAAAAAEEASMSVDARRRNARRNRVFSVLRSSDVAAAATAGANEPSPPPSPYQFKYNGYNTYLSHRSSGAFATLQGGSGDDAVVTTPDQLSPCTINGRPALYTLPPTEEHISGTASVCAPGAARCVGRTILVAFPFDVLRTGAVGAATATATIVCQNVRTPLATPSTVTPTTPAYAKMRLIRPPYTTSSNYSKPLTMAYQNQVSLQSIVVPEWGATTRSVTPANVTAGSDHGVITVTIQSLPVPFTTAAEMQIILPPNWGMQTMTFGASAAGETCRGSIDNPVATQANITGLASMTPATRTILFRPASSVIATTAAFRLFCDGVKVPITPRDQLSVTVLRMNDNVLRYGNNAPTVSAIPSIVAAQKYLMTAETTRATTSRIIAGLADRELVSHTLSIELRLPLNTSMTERYVSSYMTVLSPLSTSLNLIFSASIRSNVLVTVPVVIDDPANVEYDTYVNVEIVFEGTSNTNNFDVLELLKSQKTQVAAAISTLTGQYIIHNADPVTIGIPGTCANRELDANEAAVDCGQVCLACAINSACKADADCLTSTCTNNRCEERVLVPIPGKPVQPNAATTAAAHAGIGTLAAGAAAVALLLFGSW